MMRWLAILFQAAGIAEHAALQANVKSGIPDAYAQTQAACIACGQPGGGTGKIWKLDIGQLNFKQSCPVFFYPSMNRKHIRTMPVGSNAANGNASTTLVQHYNYDGD
jgi:hypothetical protein